MKIKCRKCDSQNGIPPKFLFDWHPELENVKIKEILKCSRTIDIFTFRQEKVETRQEVTIMMEKLYFATNDKVEMSIHVVSEF